MNHSNCKNKILCGDCIEVLKNIPNDSVDLIITSPPYFQQRDYGNGDFGIGNEESEQAYLSQLMLVFQECVRVSKETGAIVFNLGDKYVKGGLSLLPYKFAIAAVEQCGVFLINQITWSKLNPTPRQDKRKLIQATEPFFVFAQSKNYHFDLENYLRHLDDLHKNTKKQPTHGLGKKYFELIEQSPLSLTEKEQAKKELNEAILAVHAGTIDSFRMKIREVHKLAYGGQDGGRNNQIRDKGFTIIKIWGNKLKKDLIESPVESTRDNVHPAVFPVYVVQELIKLLSKEGDLILDPFCGSGTTCLAARNLQRDYLGIEINPDYVAFAQTRLQQEPIYQDLFV